MLKNKWKLILFVLVIVLFSFSNVYPAIKTDCTLNTTEVQEQPLEAPPTLTNIDQFIELLSSTDSQLREKTTLKIGHNFSQRRFNQTIDIKSKYNL